MSFKRSMDSNSFAGEWDFPGGKVDQGENFIDALHREVAEETGLKMSIERMAGAVEFEMPNFMVVNIIMEGRLKSGDVRLSNEHEEYKWVPPDELLTIGLVEKFMPFIRSYGK